MMHNIKSLGILAQFETKQKQSQFSNDNNNTTNNNIKGNVLVLQYDCCCSRILT